MWDGKIWSARPAIVVQDEPELMAFYIPAGTVSRVHRAPGGNPVTADNLTRSDWILAEILETPEYERLKLAIPGSAYSVLIFKDFANGDLLR